MSQLPMDFRFSKHVCVPCRITTGNSAEDASASPAPSPTLAQWTVSQQHAASVRLGKLGCLLVLKEDLPGICTMMIDDLPACLIVKKSLNSRVE